MKYQFRAYYSPTAEEFQRLWDEAIIVFDANALLNFFRYSAATRDEWLELLEREKARLWLPHQVALEFHRNRRFIARQEEKAFADVEKALESAETSVRSSIDGLRRRPTLEAEELSDLVVRHMAKVRKKFKKARTRHFEAVVSQAAHDKTLEAISALYESKVGQPYGDQQLRDLYKDGADRYAKKVPPGYADEANKNSEEKYGDLVLWRQILDHGTGIKKPLVFVTDDAKEDWWLKSGTRSLGPRPELVAEYFEATGERAHFYEPRAFLKFANERGEKISDEAIAEARSVSSVQDFKMQSSTRAFKSALDTIARVQASRSQAPLGAVAQANLAEVYGRILASTSADSETIAGFREAMTSVERSTETATAIRAYAEQEARRSALIRAALDEALRTENTSSHLRSLEHQDGRSEDEMELDGEQPNES